MAKKKIEIVQRQNLKKKTNDEETSSTDIPHIQLGKNFQPLRGIGEPRSSTDSPLNQFGKNPKAPKDVGQRSSLFERSIHFGNRPRPLEGENEESPLSPGSRSRMGNDSQLPIERPNEVRGPVRFNPSGQRPKPISDLLGRLQREQDLARDQFPANLTQSEKPKIDRLQRRELGPSQPLKPLDPSAKLEDKNLINKREVPPADLGSKEPPDRGMLRNIGLRLRELQRFQEAASPPEKPNRLRALSHKSEPELPEVGPQPGPFQSHAEAPRSRELRDESALPRPRLPGTAGPNSSLTVPVQRLDADREKARWAVFYGKAQSRSPGSLRTSKASRKRSPVLTTVEFEGESKVKEQAVHEFLKLVVELQGIIDSLTGADR